MITLPTDAAREELTNGDRFDICYLALARARAVLNAIIDGDMLDSIAVDERDKEQLQEASILVSVARDIIHNTMERDDI